MDDDERLALAAELSRIEEDCIHSAKAQFNGAARLNGWHWTLGGSAAVLSAVVSASLIGNYPWVTGLLALLAAILTAVLTFIKPAERAANHQDAGNQYLAIRNEARRLRKLHLPNWSGLPAGTEFIEVLAGRHDDLNRSAIPPTQADFIKARQGIEAGEAAYLVDKGSA
ncbi:SLATT domain-containing protein [Maricaulis sp.]|uniref:SLATT domain-containing protein n=1 Tax=Maricaulis sp. TaxID=1486257 RepID=UPI003A9350E2